MDEADIKRILSSLDYEQRQILYWRCRGETDYRNIASKIRYKDPARGIGGGTVYNRLLWIYGRLDIQPAVGLNPEDEICQLYLDAIGEPPVFEPWPPERLTVSPPSTPISAILEDRAESVESATPREESSANDGEEASTPSTLEPHLHDGERRVLWLPIVAVVVILAAVGYLIFLWFQPEEPPPTETAPTQIGSSTPAALVQQEAQEQEPAQQVVPPTETASITPSPTPSPSITSPPTITPTPTNTSTVTATATETPTPTDTPLPTNTPPPTETATPTPIPTPSITLPFSDPFDGPQFGPAWDLILGQPIFGSSGVRPFDGELVFSIGENLSDIIVEFDYGVTPVLNAFDEAPQVYVSLGDEVRFAVDPEGPSQWQTFDGSEWRTLAGGREVPRNGHFRLVFSGGIYEAYLNAEERTHSTAGFGGPIFGSLKVRIAPGGRIDNLEIRQP